MTSEPAVGLFLPGYGARARSYEPGLPPEWTALQPPPDVLSSGSVDRVRRWLLDEIERRPGRVALGGHSMGAALAVLAAASAPERVAALVLVAPAGLPLTKPVPRMVYDFWRQLKAGRFCAADVLPPLGDVLRYPLAAVRLARSVRRLDLSREMAAVRDAGVPATVIACATDTLSTPESARCAADLLGARYREVALDGGHVWMFGSWELLARELTSATMSS